MPNPPYLFLSNDERRHVHRDPVDGAVELGGFLLLWRKHCWPQHTLLEVANGCLELSENHPIIGDLGRTLRAIKRARFATVSMAIMHAFDRLPVASDAEQYNILCQIVDWLGHLTLRKEAQVGIDFSEVFFVEPGRSLPAHYREGIDRVVTDVTEYQQQTAAFSYQVAKAFLGEMSFRNNRDDVERMTYPYGYAGYAARRNAHLHRFPYNELTNILELQYFLNNDYQAQVILRFGPQMSLNDLERCSVNFSPMLKEVVIFLSGAHYHTAENRQQVLNTLEQLVIAQGWRFFPQVFLLTETDAVRCTDVYQLATEPEEEAGFRALKQGLGYYLSDPRIFAAVYRNIQDHTQKKTVVLTDVLVETESTSNQKKQSTGYSCERDHRLSPSVIT